MRSTRLYIEQLATAFVVEIEYKGWIGSIALGGGNLFNREIIPQPVTATKGGNTALGTYSGTCQNNNFLHDMKNKGPGEYPRSRL